MRKDGGNEINAVLPRFVFAESVLGSSMPVWLCLSLLELWR